MLRNYLQRKNVAAPTNTKVVMVWGKGRLSFCWDDRKYFQEGVKTNVSIDFLMRKSSQPVKKIVSLNYIYVTLKMLMCQDTFTMEATHPFSWPEVPFSSGSIH